MSSPSSCPEPWELKLFALNMLSAEAAQAIEQHLGECSACRGLRQSEPAMRRAAAPFPFLSPPQEPDEIGRLGDYRVLRLLNSGGMGIVFEAEDLALRRCVALKVLKPDLQDGPTPWQRFLREARLLAAIKHENVVTVHDAGQAGHGVYLAMELLQGQSLADFLAVVRPIPVKEIVRLAREIASGLAAIHRAGLLHRDLKPANIWLEAPGPDSADGAGLGRVKILDLGLARPIQDEDGLTQTGIVVGTPAFMSPEQAEGNSLDVRSDLFSLGCVLYTLCAGAGPFFPEDAKTHLTGLAASDPPPLREQNPAIPAPLAELVRQLLARNPDERPASAREVILRLQQIETPAQQSSQPGLWGDTSRLLAESGPGPARARAATRRKWVGVLVGLLVLGAVTLAGVWGGRWGRASLGATEQHEGVRPTDGGPPSAVAGSPGRFTNALGMKFVRVPRGTFWMGGRAGEPGEKEVEVPNDFYLGVHEVTQEEWQKVMGNNPSQFSRTGKNHEDVKDVSDEDLKRFPVDSVSWEDCQEFVAVLNTKLKERGWVYRLPREVEWEYACRGGPAPAREDSAFDFYPGTPTNTLAPHSANFSASGLRRTCKVGSYAPNRLGLFDMHGNVFELCDDTVVEKEGPPLCVLRGGGWLDPATFCRAWVCNVGSSSSRYNGSGLRLARVAVGKQAR
jgi:formylglycine-generating enzyme required for sulfatase activity/tRNA A-37 threonylcarbamoyl transferase component Bud32